MGIRTEIDKSIIQTGLGEAILIRTIIVGIVLEVTVFIVVVTIAAAKDIVHTTLDILHISRGRGNISIFCSCRVMYFVLDCIVDTRHEALGSEDASTQVIAAIDVVTNPGEAQYVIAVGIHAITADVGFGMS